MKMLYLMVLSIVVIFSGCVGKEVAPYEPKVVTKKCEVSQIIKPQMSDEIGDNTTWLKARLENYPKLQSYVYDLEAALEKCK